MQIRQIPVSEPDAACSFDSLPVFQLTFFPKAPGHDLPFAQARMYAERGRSLFLRLNAYEVGAPAGSRFLAEFAGLRLTVTPDGFTAEKDGSTVEHPLIRVSPIRGEDLQGEFWGAVLQLPLTVLRETVPGARLEPGERIPLRLRMEQDTTGYAAELFEGVGSLELAAF